MKNESIVRIAQKTEEDIGINFRMGAFPLYKVVEQHEYGSRIVIFYIRPCLSEANSGVNTQRRVWRKGSDNFLSTLYIII